jgi:hypothetical protein
MAQKYDPKCESPDPFACDVPTAFRLPAPHRLFDLDAYPVFAPLPDWPAASPPRPRLILTPNRIEAIRRDIDTGFLKHLWPKLWDFHRRHHLQAPDSLQEPNREHGYILAWRAMRWAILRDPQMLDDAVHWIDAIAACPLSDHRESLTPTDVLSAMALALDWLGEALPAATAAAARRWVAAQAAQIARAAEAGAVWWADCWLQNHLVVNECGIGLAGMALADAPEADLRRVGLDLYRHAVTAMRKAVFFQPPDGSTPEMCRYTYFMSESQFLFFEALRSFSGEDLFGNFARRRIDYIIHQIIPAPTNDADILNWGDNGRSSWPHPPAGLLYCLARRFRNSLAQGAADWLVSRGVGIDRNKTWLIPLHRDPALPPTPFPPPDASLPRSYHAEDQGLVTLRSSWRDDATMLGLLCGPFQGHRLRHLADKDMGAAHRHPDNGSFQICVGNTYLTVDPGYEYLKSTANHNTILVDGRGQTGEGNMWLNVNNCLTREHVPLGIMHFEDAGDVCHVVADVTGAYDPDLHISRCTRRIVYSRPDLIVIHDRIDSELPHEYRWLLHTDPKDRFNEIRPGYWRLEAADARPRGAAVGDVERTTGPVPATGNVGLDICVLWPTGDDMCHDVRPHRVTRSRFVSETRRLDLYTSRPHKAVEFLVLLRILRAGNLSDLPPLEAAAKRTADQVHLTGAGVQLTWNTT